MTAGLRERPAAAVRASPIDWLTWGALRRSLLAAVAIGAFMSVVGAYGSGRMPIAERSVMMITLAVVATLLGIAAMAAASFVRWAAARWWRHGAVAGLLMTPPMSLFSWAAACLFDPDPPPLGALPAFVPTTLASSLFFCLWAAQAGHRRRAGTLAPAAPPREPATPRFLLRLPPKLRGAELWAIEAEDHYLRLHTSLGQDLILMRLSDAVAELEGVEGAQTHRSWWVAREAVLEVRRADGRAELTLKGGSRAPVSRTQARKLRAQGWL